MSVCCQHLLRKLYLESLVEHPRTSQTRSAASTVREGLGIRPGLVPFMIGRRAPVGLASFA